MQRHLGSKSACQGNVSLLGSGPVSQQHISTLLRLQHKQARTYLHNAHKPRVQTT